MKTKRILSGLAALAMVSAIAPMSAFAENETGGSTNVTFDAPRNSPEFTITIPATVDLNAENPTATIKAENVYLDTTKHKQINVTLDSADYVETGASTFIAKTEDGNSQVTYTIGKDTATTGIAVGDTVAEFTEDGTQVLTFSEPTGATYAGKHTETLTFGISVEDATVAVLVLISQMLLPLPLLLAIRQHSQPKLNLTMLPTRLLHGVQVMILLQALTALVK